MKPARLLELYRYLMRNQKDFWFNILPEEVPPPSSVLRQLERYTNDVISEIQ